MQIKTQISRLLEDMDIKILYDRHTYHSFSLDIEEEKEYVLCTLLDFITDKEMSLMQLRELLTSWIITDKEIVQLHVNTEAEDDIEIDIDLYDDDYNLWKSFYLDKVSILTHKTIENFRFSKEYAEGKREEEALIAEYQQNQVTRQKHYDNYTSCKDMVIDAMATFSGLLLIPLVHSSSPLELPVGLITVALVILAVVTARRKQSSLTFLASFENKNISRTYAYILGDVR